MSKPTLNNGDLWSQSLANASIRPTISTADEPGTLPLIRDTDLSVDSDQLLSRFNSFHNRVKITSLSGLALAYGAYTVRLSDGLKLSKTSGNIVLTNNATSFVYIDSTGSIVSGLTLPNECVPLAKVVTLSGAITTLDDIRHQTSEVISPIKLPAIASPFSPGDIKTTLSNVAQSGWFFIEGQSISKIDYPALFDIFGYTYGGSGNNFNLPDFRERSLVNASSTLAVGAVGGRSSVTLTVNELPSHSHGVLDGGHNHGVVQTPHTHTTTEQPHDHNINDPGHFHTTCPGYKPAALNSDSDDGSGAETSRQGNGNELTTSKVQSNINIIPNRTGLTVNPANTNIYLNPSTSNIAIGANGGNAAFDIRNPYAVVRYLIKT